MRAWSRWAWALATAVALAVGAHPAAAFTIASGFTESCHERLGLAGMALLLRSQQPTNVVVPAGELWRRVAAEIAPAVLSAEEAAAVGPLTDAQTFVLYSVVVGIRSPDTGGHSVSNLNDLRRAQIDADPSSQHLHCLRASTEDGLAADLAVVQDTERIIRKALADAVAAAGQARNTTVPFYLDFYGPLQVEVDQPSYLIGRAMHTLQDCYAHNLRSADGRTIYTVLNYIDAVAGKLNEARDGMAHSDTMDDCRRSELAPLVQRATGVSAALARAAVALSTSGDATLLDQGFAACAAGQTDPTACEWIHYQPGCDPKDPAATGACCTADNAYCGSPYLAVAREKLTRPYVEEVLSCAAGGRVRSVPAFLLLMGPLLWLLGRRRRRAGAALVLAAGLLPAMARAEPSQRWFATLEGHVSLLSDAPERSFLDITTGYALRAGRRFGDWAALLQVERNYWLPTELSHDLEPGALNLGLGGEWLTLQGHLRLSATAGPSILWFDTALDDKGTVGVFMDLRPAGFRWRVGDHFTLAFDPLSLALVAPVLGDPGIVQVEYRTLLGIELAR
jgi:hypothetical protein